MAPIKDKKTISIKEAAILSPSLLREDLSPQERKDMGRSARYSVFSSVEIIDIMDKLGWEMVGVKQSSRQERNKDKTDIGRHLVRFRPKKLILQVDEVFPEVLMVNSHDGTGSFQFDLSLFRTICANGLVTREKIFETFKARHIDNKFEVAKEYVNLVVNNIGVIEKKIKTWQEIKLDEKQQLKYATRALVERYPEYFDAFDNAITAEQLANLNEHFEPIDLLKVQRPGDNYNDLWHVYNRVQENLIKGNFKHYGSPVEDPETKEFYYPARKARNIDITQEGKFDIRNSLVVNKGLWKITNEYALNLS